MKNKYLLYLGIASVITPVSALLWIGWIVKPVSPALFIGGVAVAALLVGASLFLAMRSRESCLSCGANMEKQLFQVEKLATLGTLAGGVAHEVNTPASIISGRIEAMLLDRKRYNNQDIEDLSVIKTQAERVTQITRNLLLFAKRSPAEKNRADLNDIVSEAVSLLENPLHKAKIEIERRLFPQPLIVMGQPNQMTQVVLNLLANARDAMVDGGKVTLSTGIMEGVRKRVFIEVRDTGPGISNKDRNKIFDPFFTTKKSGTGLGLSVSYGIVQEHGGTIDAKNNEDGGASFFVTLPAA